jgi:hypothetical protein
MDARVKPAHDESGFLRVGITPQPALRHTRTKLPLELESNAWDAVVVAPQYKQLQAIIFENQCMPSGIMYYSCQNGCDDLPIPMT